MGLRMRGRVRVRVRARLTVRVTVRVTVRGLELVIEVVPPCLSASSPPWSYTCPHGAGGMVGGGGVIYGLVAAWFHALMNFQH